MTPSPQSLYDIESGRQDPEAVERLLSALPEWFGIQESVSEYVEDARAKPTYLAADRLSGEVLGVLLLTEHNPRSVEIHLLAVAPDHHRRGIGRALVTAFEKDMSSQGVEVVQVKTQGPSRFDEDYARTLQFYLAMNYVPLEEITGLWPDNPCLILVKAL